MLNDKIESTKIKFLLSYPTSNKNYLYLRHQMIFSDFKLGMAQPISEAGFNSWDRMSFRAKTCYGHRLMCIISIEKIVLFIYFVLIKLSSTSKKGFDHPFYNQMHT